jgi:capsular polysaccharide biosynthesis protein
MDLIASLRRRWILTSILLLFTLAGTILGILKLAPTYQSQSSIILLASKTSSKGFGGNPYLAFNATLNQTADVVRYETMDKRTVTALAKSGYTSTYLVTDAIDTSGPVLIITVTGHEKAVVERTLSGVTTEARAKLDGLQTGLLSVNKIRSLVITYTPTPTVVASKKARPLSLIAGAGVLLTIGVPLSVDAAIMRRRAERGAQLRRGGSSAAGRGSGPAASRTPQDADGAADGGYQPRPRRPAGEPGARPRPKFPKDELGDRPRPDRDRPEQGPRPDRDRPEQASRPDRERPEQASSRPETGDRPRPDRDRPRSEASDRPRPKFPQEQQPARRP